MFTVKWVERFDEISPVSIEAHNRQTLDEIFDRCKVRLFGMRLKNGASLLDGFIILGEDGVERRRWFELSPTQEAAIISGARQRLGSCGLSRERLFNESAGFSSEAVQLRLSAIYATDTTTKVASRLDL
jgi:hypothetical protein